MSEKICNKELTERLAIIENSHNYAELEGSGILPEPDLTESYYFVSYSHKDYKRVLKDIIHLKEHGIQIWYDRGLEAGKSWRDEALKKMTSYNCKGVIIYISKQFVESAACNLELKTAIQDGKSAVIVDMDGSINSIEMGNQKQQARWKQYQEKSVVLSCNTNYDKFAESIIGLKSPELFSYKFCDYKKFAKQASNDSTSKWRSLIFWFFFRLVLGSLGTKVALVKTINDKDVESVQLPAYVYDGKKQIKIVGIDEGAFSNCVNLRRVEIPAGWLYISRGAFYNCVSLKEVTLGTPGKFIFSLKLGEIMMPFEHCVSFEKLTTPKRGKIFFNGTFYGCKQLKSWTCPKNVILSDGVFSGCTALERVKISKRSILGSRYQFFNCRNLAQVEIDSRSRGRIIYKSAFYNCQKLKEIKLNKRIREIEASAFENCGLTEIELPQKTRKVDVSAFKDCKNLTYVKLNCKQIKIITTDGHEASLDEAFPFVNTVIARKKLKIKFTDKFTVTKCKGAFLTYERCANDR